MRIINQKLKTKIQNHKAKIKKLNINYLKVFNLWF